jgi:hypothetical protein
VSRKVPAAQAIEAEGESRPSTDNRQRILIKQIVDTEAGREADQ